MASAFSVTPPVRPPFPLWFALLLAVASGPVVDAGFPDQGWWPLTLVGVALVLVSLRGRRPRTALLLGFLSGLAFYLVHIQWAALFLGPVPMTALSVLESLFVALGVLAMTLAYRWLPNAWPGRLGRLIGLPTVIAGLWTCREAIDSTWPYGGFAWGRVALSQAESPFASLFSWIGVSGVTFVVVFLVAATIEIAREHRAEVLPRVTAVVVAFAVVWAVPSFPIAITGRSTIAAVQGNGKAAYFDTREEGDLLRAQYDATEPLFGKTVDMVVWPEGATDLNPLQVPEAAAAFDRVSRGLSAPLIAGAITQRGTKYFNTSLLWEAGDGAVDYYDKKHPVPFGEYVPDRAFWTPFAPDLINLIGREYTPGTTDTVFHVNGVTAGIDICFDISDDAVMNQSVKEGAEVLIAQTNNADFGHTDESVQQLAIARIRAMELGRSVVNISTVGTSAMISPSGRTIAQLPTFVAGTMVQSVPLSTTVTPASWLGQPVEWLVSWFALAALLMAGLVSRAPKKKE